MAVAKLKNVRIVYPKMFTPNERGKYTVGVLIRQDSDAYKEFMRAVSEAWKAGRDKFGAQQFCPNPTRAQVFNRAYCKEGGGLDSKGNPVPEWYDGCIGFTANSKTPAQVIDRRGLPVKDGDAAIYDGQIAHVSIDVQPVYKEGNPCIGRYLRCIMIVGGGERIETGSSGEINAAAEFAEDIDPNAPADDAGFDAFAEVPY